MSPATRQLAFINLAHGFTHYCLLILPTAVLAMVLDPKGPFGDDYELILPLATGGFVLYGLLSLPQGWLAARVGRHNLMTAFFLGCGRSAGTLAGGVRRAIPPTASTAAVATAAPTFARRSRVVCARSVLRFRRGSVARHSLTRRRLAGIRRADPRFRLAVRCSR